MVWIVEEARMDRVDDAPGRRGLGGDRSRQFDRVPVAYQAAKIDDMISSGQDLHRRQPRVDPCFDQSTGNVLLYGLVGRQARLFRCLDFSGAKPYSEACKDYF